MALLLVPQYNLLAHQLVQLKLLQDDPNEDWLPLHLTPLEAYRLQLQERPLPRAI